MKRPILIGLILLGLILPLLIIPSLYDLYILPKITFLSCLLAVLILLWAVRVRTSANAITVYSPLFWPILLFFGLNLLSLVKAVNVHEGLYHILWLFTYILLFLLVVNNLDVEDLKKIAYWSIIGGVIVAAIGIGQFWGLRIPFLPIRLGATLGTKNMSAQHILLVLPLSFLSFFFYQDTRKEFFYGLAGATMAIFLVYTQSRGSWVGFIGAAVFMLLLVLRSSRFPDWRRLWQLNAKKLSILCLCTGFFLIGISMPHFIKVPGVAEPEEFGERFESIFGAGDLSTQTRLAMWANTLDMVKDNYVLGVGAGNWKFVYPMYSRSRMVDPAFTEKTQPADAHNDWIQMPAEIGVGLLAFLWLIFAAYKTGWKVFAKSVTYPHENSRYVGLTVFFLLFSILGLLISAVFDFPFRHPVPVFYFWMFLGFIQITRNSLFPLREGQGKSRRFVPYVLILACFFVVCFAGLNFLFLKGSYHFRQGWVLFKRGQVTESVVKVKKATALDPANYRFHTALSRVYFETRQYDQMGIAARLALLYHPHYSNAWNNLGVAYNQVGLLSEAEEAFHKALRIYPDYYLAHLNLGSLYLDMGDKEKAEKEYRAALDLKPGSRKALEGVEAVRKYQNDKLLSK